MSKSKGNKNNKNDKHKFNKNIKSSNQSDYIKKKQYNETVVLSEKDFYPPPDTRCYKSGIDDIRGGDTFKDYAEYFWQEYYDELFDD